LIACPPIFEKFPFPSIYSAALPFIDDALGPNQCSAIFLKQTCSVFSQVVTDDGLYRTSDEKKFMLSLKNGLGLSNNDIFVKTVSYKSFAEILFLSNSLKI